MDEREELVERKTKDPSESLIMDQIGGKRHPMLTLFLCVRNFPAAAANLASAKNWSGKTYSYP